MTIGALLLQPQPIDRFRQFNYDQAFGDDAVALMQKIAMNPEWLEPLVNQVSDHLEDFIADMQAHVESRMSAAQSAMQGMITPFLNSLNDLIGDDLAIETVGDALKLVLDLADKATVFIESVSLDKLRSWVEDLLNILFETIGFNQTYLQDLLSRFIDIVINAMETIPAGASNAYIELQWQVASLAKRLKRDILSSLPELNFNAETIARLLMNKLREMGLETIQEKAQCLAGKVRALVDAGTSIYDLAKAVEGGGSVGALQKISPIRTGQKYCWYASWLYQNRRRKLVWQYFGTYLLPLVPKDEVWISEDGTKLILRHATTAANSDGNSDHEDEILYQSPNGQQIHWYDAPQFKNTSGEDEHFTFTGALSADFMENWTICTNMLVILFRLGGHAVHAFEPGNHVTHSILWAWHTCRLFAEPMTTTPFTSFIRDKWKLGTANKSWIDLMFYWLPIFGGSFEGFNTGSNGGFQHWMTLIGDDAHDTFLIYLWPTLAFEGFLSIFTLINQKGPGYTDFNDTGKPKNYEYSYPLTNIWLIFYSWLQSRVALPRQHYSHPFEETHMGPFLKNQLAYSWMFGALAGITGELFGWAFSRTVSPRRLLIQLGWGAYKGFGTYIVCSYFWNEGDTDGGRYNPNRRTDSDGDLEYFEDTEFEGYGDHTTSPYRLPIADGRPIFVGQANQGMFSHFIDDDGTIQIYAADFAHAFKEMVVAIRDGTVVDYFDWIDDDIDPETADQNNARDEARASGDLVSNGTDSQTAYTDPAPGGTNPGGPGIGSWNFIIIQHNDPFGEESNDEKGHDLDEGGAAVTTYAFYGHGAKGGVRAAFDERGIAPADIIGQQVRRGENIMWAGDTGVSFHNHLHLHVRPGPAPANPATDPMPQIVNSGDMTGRRTLPIVFRDAKAPFKSSGRLHHLTWYRSGNTPPEDP
ncbi:hypothetical protein [Hahella ganghwensis]|uniref:hypothetical protein n=1 Tax=Hahella ganghwensis TaxID=286420 RepID=UPI0003694CF2|nr:hypothetical protein [Hahella ganghwensis]